MTPKTGTQATDHPLIIIHRRFYDNHEILRRYANLVNSDQLRKLYDRALRNTCILSLVMALGQGINYAINFYLWLAFSPDSAIHAAPLPLQMLFKVTKVLYAVSQVAQYPVIMSSVVLCSWFIPRFFILSVGHGSTQRFPAPPT